MTTRTLPPTVASARDTLAFLRDPGVFTAGPGRALGDFYRVRIPGRRFYVVTHPDLVGSILVGQGSCFEKSRTYWGELRRIIGEAMASVEGEAWAHLHGIEQPYFTPRAAGRYLPTAEAITRSEFDELEEQVGSGRSLPLLDVVSRLNTRLVLRIFFGQDGGELRREITRRIVDGEETIAWRSRFPWRSATAWLNGRNARARGHRAFFQDYADRVEDSEAASTPGLLVEAICRMRSDEAAPRYPHALLRNEMIVHLGASTETQGAAQAWCLYLLWKHPDVLARLREEVSRVAGAASVSVELLPSLPFTLQVIRETLRLFPTAYGVVRDCVRPTELAGNEVRKRDTFFISVVGLHRSPRFWSDPDAFDPDRFRADRLGAIPSHLYIPFGGGRHVCIGQHFALPSMTLAIAQFAQRFRWSFLDPDVRPVGKATLKPRGPFLATVSPLH